jgi:adenylate cyclase
MRMVRPGGRFRVRTALFLGVGLGLTGFVMIAYGGNVLRPWEFDTVDARFGIRGKETPPAQLVTVLIDDKTFDDFNRTKSTRQLARWPFRRIVHARVLDRLREDGVKAVAYDVQFSEQSPGRQGLIDDNALIESLYKLRGHVVLATTEVDDEGNPNVFGGDPAFLKEFGLRAGNANYANDEDGAIRRLVYQIEKLKTFPVMAAEIALGRTIEESDLPQNPVWIDFAGPPDSIPHVSLSDVYFGKTPKGFFKDKVVVVGPAAPSLQDVHETATTGGTKMPGAEVQASSVSTALRGFPLASTPKWFDFALILFAGLVVPVAGLRLSFRSTLFFAIGAGLVFLLATQLAFNAGWVLTFVYPMIALVLATVGALGAYYLLSVFERQRTRDTFARFVPEAVVDQLLTQGDGSLRLATTQVFGTCMFTDIRGFTTFSEGHTAPQVIDVLNRYLAEMSDAILQQGGTLASFLGDGFMAVFGAPLEQPDHADRALAAARDIVEVRLPRFNAQLQEEGVPGFNMGIGLNSGQFMSGNVGSEQRLQYTVIGDTINTASRIEGLTKGSGHIIFLADSTREALVNPPEDLVYVDEFDIRGRQSRVKLWSITGRPQEATAGQAEAEPAPEGVPITPAGI